MGRPSLCRSWLIKGVLVLLACEARREPVRRPPPDAPPVRPAPPPVPPMPWETGPSLGDGEAYFLVGAGQGRDRGTWEAALAEGMIVVDLSDDWVPFIFSEGGDGAGAPGGKQDAEKKPNAYRDTFIALANDRTSPDELFFESPAGRAAVLATVPEEDRSGKLAEPSAEELRTLERAARELRSQRAPNHLEVYGIPPTLTVLARRVAKDARRTCYSAIDVEGLRAFDGDVTYQTREQARRDYSEALADARWVAEKLAELPPDGGAAPTAAGDGAVRGGGRTLASLAADPKLAPRVERYRRGQARLCAVRAAQARLACEELLAPGGAAGVFDVTTNEALAEFEKKNDIFGWGFIGGETLAALQRPVAQLHWDTFKRILAERMADAAGILEDGSANRATPPATFKDMAGREQPVPNVIAEHVDALLAAMKLRGPDDLPRFLRAIGQQGFARFRVAIPRPSLPPYYGEGGPMDLAAQIDRGDVWYDPPFDHQGRPTSQRRVHYPTLTMLVRWNQQEIPLARWRTTIGSWRSELHDDGRVYLRYKNSDVGPRWWKRVVASPVWIPPDGTPPKDLLTKRVFDRTVGPVTLVNTEVMGPGFASAYGLVMAIHERKNGFDNQIRTHGSVDYTSNARRFSHGCHRIVNNRAVRLFDFILRRRGFRRVGDNRLAHFKKRFEVDDHRHEYELATRGYNYELDPPIPVNVLEGRIMGRVKRPVLDYMHKPGVDYGSAPGDGANETAPAAGP